MKCLFCKELIKNKGKYYCGRNCYWQSKKGTTQSESHRNKISLALKGKPKSEQHIKNASNARRGNPVFKLRNEGNSAWKGDGVGYDALHDWVKRRFKVKDFCSKCIIPNKRKISKDGKSRNYLHLANLSGKYHRDLKDWDYLCPKCHSKLDRNREVVLK